MESHVANRGHTEFEYVLLVEHVFAKVVRHTRTDLL
jgi:hypothetical protein